LGDGAGTKKETNGLESVLLITFGLCITQPFCLQNLASRSLVDDILNKVEGLKPIATELNVPMSQLAIAWCAANPNVSSVITGATKEHQVTLTPIQKFPDLIPSIMG
jgi:hypothetical protein